MLHEFCGAIVMNSSSQKNVCVNVTWVPTVTLMNSWKECLCNVTWAPKVTLHEFCGATVWWIAGVKGMFM
jgi:hypothetical protein